MQAREVSGSALRMLELDFRSRLFAGLRPGVSSSQFMSLSQHGEVNSCRLCPVAKSICFVKSIEVTTNEKEVSVLAAVKDDDQLAIADFNGA